MNAGGHGRDAASDDGIVGADVRELVAADDERVPPDLHAAVTAMAREAQGLPGGAAALPAGALPLWQRLVPIAAVLVLSVGVVPLVVRDAPTGSEVVAVESAPASATGTDRAAPVADTEALRTMPEAPDALAARSPGVDEAVVRPLSPAAMPKAGTPRDGARRIVRRLRERGVDAALESYAAWRALWPEADLEELVGEATDDELERLREAVVLRGLPPLSPSP